MIYSPNQASINIASERRLLRTNDLSYPTSVVAIFLIIHGWIFLLNGVPLSLINRIRITSFSLLLQFFLSLSNFSNIAKFNHPFPRYKTNLWICNLMQPQYSALCRAARDCTPCLEGRQKTAASKGNAVSASRERGGKRATDKARSGSSSPIAADCIYSTSRRTDPPGTWL